MLEKCTICPRNCKANRSKGNKGYCKCNDKIKLALVSTHEYEEPCISKINGSGTIFFSNCNLNCIYCQNYEISQEGKRNRNRRKKTKRDFPRRASQRSK